MHQETHSNFLGIFAKNLTRIEVQIAKIGVYIAQEFQENLRKPEAHSFTAQTHGSDGSGSS